MSWVRAIGTACLVLTAPALAAAEPTQEVAPRDDIREPGSTRAPPATVPSAPQPREISRTDRGDEATLRAQQTEPPLWYGWQTLALDGFLLVGVMALAQQADGNQSELSETLAWVPVVGFAVGGPTIHIVHREPWRAVGSLGLRAGLPVLGGAIGTGMLATCPPPDGDYGSCGLGELIIGAAAGVLAASLIDGLALARESAKKSSDLGLSLTPLVSPDGSTRALALRGRF
jgi:hypothetical protein